MTTSARHKYMSSRLVWFFLWLAMMVTALATRPLIPIDETRYLSVAWEMWQSHNFIVPHINGQPYSHKPPLLFWLIHLIWLLFGTSELPARMIGPLCGLGSIILTIRLARQLWPDRPETRQAVPYIMIGSIVWSLFSSLTMFDALLTAIILFCLLCIHKASDRLDKRRPWLLLGLGIGLGLLAKGPIVFLYLAPPLLLAPFWWDTGIRNTHRWYLYAAFSCLLGIVVALCWALPAAYIGGNDYARAIFFSQTAGRMVKAFAHDRPFYWYLLVTPLLLFPWFFWLPAWNGLRKLLQDRSIRFCLAVVLPAWTLLSLVSGKQLHYLLPSLPIIALVLARSARPVWTSTPLQRSLVVIVLFGMGVGLLLLPHLELQGGDRKVLTMIPGWLPFLLWGGAVAMLLPTPSQRTEIRLIAAVMATIFICIHLALAGPLQQIYSQREIGTMLGMLSEETVPLAVYPHYLSDQFQFSGKLTQPVFPATSPVAVHQWARLHPKGYCLFFARKIEDIPQKTQAIANRYKNGWLILAPSASFQ